MAERAGAHRERHCGLRSGDRARVPSDDGRVHGSVESLIGEGRDAFARGDAAASRRAYEAALAEREGGEVLEGLARALYLEGDYPGSMAAHERAFAAYRDEE